MIGRSSNVGNGLKFDGIDDYVDVNHEAWDHTSLMTVHCIFKYIFANPVGKLNLFSPVVGGTILFGMRTNIGGNQNNVGFYRRQLNSSGIIEVTSPLNSLTLGSLNIATMVKPNTTNNNFKAFLNGEYIGESSDNNTDDYATAFGVRFARNSGTHNIFHYSRYNTALTDEEVIQLHNDLVFPESARLAYYDFNQKHGNFLPDLSGNGNHGTLQGFGSTSDYGGGAWVDERGETAK